MYPQEIYAALPQPTLIQTIEKRCDSIAPLPEADEGFVTSASENDRVQRWKLQDNNTFQVSQEIANVGEPSPVMASADGNFIAVELGQSVPISIYKRDSNDQFVWRQDIFTHGDSTHSKVDLAISSRTLVLSYAKRDHEIGYLEIFLWNKKNDRFEYTQTIEVNNQRTRNIRINGDGDRFIVNRTHTIEMWSLNHNSGLYELKWQTALNNPSFWVPMTITPDGAFIAWKDNETHIVIGSVGSQDVVTRVQDIDLAQAASHIRFSSNSPRLAENAISGNQRLAINAISGVQIWENTNDTFKLILTIPVMALETIFIGENYLATSSGPNLEIWQLYTPSLDDVWDYILNYSDIPALEDITPEQ